MGSRVVGNEDGETVGCSVDTYEYVSGSSINVSIPPSSIRDNNEEVGENVGEDVVGEGVNLIGSIVGDNVVGLSCQDSCLPPVPKSKPLNRLLLLLPASMFLGIIRSIRVIARRFHDLGMPVIF